MTPIVNDSPISFTCCVCGSPVNPLAKGLPDLLGEFSTKCRKCGKAVCREHFDKKTGAIAITDKIESDGQHVYEIPFHLHPEIRVEQESANGFMLSHPRGRAVRLLLDECLQPGLIKGAEGPILGWYSPSFLQKEPTTTIYSRLEMAGSFQLITIIEPQN